MSARSGPERADDAWMEHAACRGETKLFFAQPREQPQDRLERLIQAVRVCGSCRVKPECREYALSVPEIHGVWAGRDFDGGRE